MLNIFTTFVRENPLNFLNMNIESLLNSIFSDAEYNIKDVFEQKLIEYNLSRTKAGQFLLLKIGFALDTQEPE